MIISKIRLRNWKNFRDADVRLRERVYVIGPNASGKSNFLDVVRFLRDIAKTEGGGFQKAVKDRGGITKLRSLAARKDPSVLVEVELAADAASSPKWRYLLEFKNEGSGLRRTMVSREIVTDLVSGEELISRPDSRDAADSDRLTQTALEQISDNQHFREIADFFGAATYLHLVPQLLKYSELLGGYKLENDPFGQGFLENVAKTTERTRKSRLKRMGEALRVCVPNMQELQFERDQTTGRPHLEARFEHWRPGAGWQREDQFSDGTLRLLGIMWSLLDGDSVLLLEEPELSLNEDIVGRIHKLIWDMQRTAKHRRQVFITTHSNALLSDKSIDPREVLRLEPSTNGTAVHEATTEEKDLISSGYSVAEVQLQKVKPKNVEQLILF